jgi:hypothetical protein
MEVEAMATIFVRHMVKDFDAWKAAYDEFESDRRAMGVTGHGVYQADGNRNDVTVYHHFENMEAAKEFAGSARLKETMEKAGVDGTPDMWLTTQV